MKYYHYCPVTHTLDVLILGPDVVNGDMLQVPAPGGIWRGATLLPDPEHPEIDFCLVGEGVAPGRHHQYIKIEQTEKECH